MPSCKKAVFMSYFCHCIKCGLKRLFTGHNRVPLIKSDVVLHISAPKQYQKNGFCQKWVRELFSQSLSYLRNSGKFIIKAVTDMAEHYKSVKTVHRNMFPNTLYYFLQMSLTLCLFIEFKLFHPCIFCQNVTLIISLFSELRKAIALKTMP